MQPVKELALVAYVVVQGGLRDTQLGAEVRQRGAVKAMLIEPACGGLIEHLFLQLAPRLAAGCGCIPETPLFPADSFFAAVVVCCHFNPLVKSGPSPQLDAVADAESTDHLADARVRVRLRFLRNELCAELPSGRRRERLRHRAGDSEATSSPAGMRSG